MLISEEGNFVFIHRPRTGGNFFRYICRFIDVATWLHRHGVSEKITVWAFFFYRSLNPSSLAKRCLRQFLRRFYRPGMIDFFGTGKKISAAGGLHNRKDLPEKWTIENKEISFLFHKGYSDIPAIHRNRRIVSIVRDPFPLYQSLWKYYGGRPLPEQRKVVHQLSKSNQNIRKQYPDFPFMSFPDYIHFNCEVYNAIRMQARGIRLSIGELGATFIELYFREPEKIFAMTEGELRTYADSNKYHDDMCPVTFLRTENLNADMYNFLQQQMRHLSPSFLDSLRGIVLNAKTLNVSQTVTSKLWTDELQNFVREKEWFYCKVIAGLYCESSASHTPSPPIPVSSSVA